MFQTLRRLLAASVLALASEAQTPPAPAASPTAGDSLGWHTVLAGETLMGITHKYLGSSSAWRENWRLNPDVADPHRLTPGQKIRIIVSRHVRTAELAALSRKVEEKPFPEPWTSARIGDRLRERDGLRTHERASALLKFEDETRLYVTEQSVVFLRDAGSRLEGVERKSLEIVEGQADLAAPKTASTVEIEIVVGAAQARPRGGTEAGTRSRARKAAAGGAQFMVYAGTADVAAAGKAVNVETGMGTSVPKDGPPTPPERLLPAPRLATPTADAILDHSNPQLAWDLVPDAVSYVVEACADVDCGQLLARHTGVSATRFQVEPLPLADVFLRVTAVSVTGLDGFPGEPVRVSVRSLYRRPPPPTFTPRPEPTPGADGAPGAPPPRPGPTPPRWKPGVVPLTPTPTPTPAR